MPSVRGSAQVTGPGYGALLAGHHRVGACRFRNEIDNNPAMRRAGRLGLMLISLENFPRKAIPR